MNITFYIYGQPELSQLAGSGIFANPTATAQLTLINQLGLQHCGKFAGNSYYPKSIVFPTLEVAIDAALVDTDTDVAVFVGSYSILHRSAVSANQIHRAIERQVEQYELAAMFASFVPNISDTTHGIIIQSDTIVLNMQVFRKVVPSGESVIVSNDVAVQSNVLSFDDASNVAGWVRGFPLPALLSPGFGSGLVRVIADACGLIGQLDEMVARAFVSGKQTDEFAVAVLDYINVTPVNAPIVRVTENAEGYALITDKVVDVLVHPAIGISPFIAWCTVDHAEQFTTILTPADVQPVANDFIVWTDLIASWDGTQAGYNAIIDAHLAVLTEAGSWYIAGYGTMVADACVELGYTTEQFIEAWNVYKATNFITFDSNIATDPAKLLNVVPDAIKRGNRCVIYTGNAFMNQYMYFREDVKQLQANFLEVFKSARFNVVGSDADGLDASIVVLR